MPAGYSGKTLSEKLSLKPGERIHTVNAPENYAELLETTPPGLVITELPSLATVGRVGFLHYFVTQRKELVAASPALASSIAPGGTLWVSWPKRSAAKQFGMATDVTEETLREVLLPTGLVDVKVCAVSALWSGLKFVWRKN